MKAWYVTTEFTDYCLILHADTRGQAKSKARDNDPGYEISDEDWTKLNCYRLKELDDKPINNQTLAAAGWTWRDEDGMENWDWVDDCGCEICRGGR